MSGVRGMLTAGWSRRDAAGSTGRRVTRRFGGVRPGRSGGGAADGDLGCCGAGGRLAVRLLKGLAGFGLMVAVPVAVDGEPPPADAGDHSAAGGADGAAGQAGGGGPVAGGGDGGAAGGGEGDLAGGHGLAGAAALAVTPFMVDVSAEFEMNEITMMVKVIVITAVAAVDSQALRIKFREPAWRTRQS